MTMDGPFDIFVARLLRNEGTIVEAFDEVVAQIHELQGLSLLGGAYSQH